MKVRELVETAFFLVVVLALGYGLLALSGFNRPPCDQVDINAPCSTMNP